MDLLAGGRLVAVSLDRVAQAELSAALELKTTPTVVSFAGPLVSCTRPSGPAMVTLFGLTLLLAGIVRHVAKAPRRGATLLGVGAGFAATALVVALGLLLFRADGEDAHGHHPQRRPEASGGPGGREPGPAEVRAAEDSLDPEMLRLGLAAAEAHEGRDAKHIVPGPQGCRPRRAVVSRVPETDSLALGPTTRPRGISAHAPRVGRNHGRPRPLGRRPDAGGADERLRGAREDHAGGGAATPRGERERGPVRARAPALSRAAARRG